MTPPSALALHGDRMRAAAFVAAALTFGQACGGPTNSVNPPAASASAAVSGAGAPPFTAPARGPTEGEPRVVRQLSIGADAWTIYSPDGRLAFGAAVGHYALVEVDTGVVRAELAVSCARGATFSGDGRYVVYVDCPEAGDDGAHGIHVWDLATNRTVDAPLQTNGVPNLAARPGGHEILVQWKGSAVVLDLWAPLASPFAARKLEVPLDADILLPQLLADGRIALWGRAELLSYVEGSSAATRTGFGPRAFAAGDVDPESERAAVLLEDGAVQTIDGAGRRALEAPMCEGKEKPRNVYFGPKGAARPRRLIVHCGARVVEVDEQLGSPRTILTENGDFRIDLAGAKLLVERASGTTQLLDVATGAALVSVPMTHAEPVAAGARIGGRGALFDAVTGNAIWTSRSSMPYAVYALEESIAVLIGARMDLRTGEHMSADATNTDGSVVVAVTKSTSGETRTATVTNRVTGKSWTLKVDPGGVLSVSRRGDHVVEQTTDWSKRAGTAVVVVHGERSQRRIEVQMPNTAISPKDVLLVATFTGAGLNVPVVLAHDLATGAESTLQVDGRETLRFAGDAFVFARGGFWDIAGRREAWHVADGEQTYGFDERSDVVVVGPTRDRGRGDLRVVSLRDGKPVSTVPFADRVLSMVGHVLLLQRGDDVVLVRDGAETTVPLPERFTAVAARLSDDAAFVTWSSRLRRRYAPKEARGVAPRPTLRPWRWCHGRGRAQRSRGIRGRGQCPRRSYRHLRAASLLLHGAELQRFAVDEDDPAPLPSRRFGERIPNHSAPRFLDARPDPLVRWAWPLGVGLVGVAHRVQNVSRRTREGCGRVHRRDLRHPFAIGLLVRCEARLDLPSALLGRLRVSSRRSSSRITMPLPSVLMISKSFSGPRPGRRAAAR